MTQGKHSVITCDYETLYNRPLEWCPLFGCIPEIEKSKLIEDSHFYDLGILCRNIITEARDDLLFRLFENISDPVYRHYSKFDTLKTTNKFLPKINKRIRHKNEQGVDVYFFDECEAVRTVFRRLDYIVLINSDMAKLINGAGRPDAVGRKSHLFEACTFSHCAADKTIITRETYENILSEAQNVIGRRLVLHMGTVLRLFAILEAWLVFTAILFEPNENELLRRTTRAHYANALLIEGNYEDIAQSNGELMSYFLRQRKEQRDKALEASSMGGGNSVNGIKEAIKGIITNTLPHANHVQVFYHIKKYHTGKTKALRCGHRLIFWRNDKSGKHPEGFIIEYDTKMKREIKPNIMKSFERNYSKAKDEINKEIYSKEKDKINNNIK